MKLWIVSASNATDPEIATTPSWSTAVSANSPNEIQVARVPSRDASAAASAGPKWS